MENAKFRFNFTDLNIEVSQVVAILGYEQGDSQEAFSDQISEVLKESETICNIKAEYRIFQDVQFDDNEKTVKINSQVFYLKKVIYGQLKKSESIGIFLCTAGEEIGIRSKEAMNQGDLLKGYIFDIVGSLMVEAAADLMQTEFKKSMVSCGKKITNHYSPGHCGWDVADQHKLFYLIPENFCDIKLTESALMNPVKSASGFIGIGENVKYNPSTCGLCDLKDCMFRKVRENKHA